MKISTTLEKAINEQINKEFSAAYNYLGKSAYLETTAFNGFASWMRQQAKEETAHAMKFFDYLDEREGTVVLADLKAPTSTYDSVLAVFQDSYKSECAVTQQIHALYKLAQEENDYATVELLDWFLAEQVEEEHTAQDMIDRLTLAGDSPDALLRLDAEAGERVDKD